MDRIIEQLIRGNAVFSEAVPLECSAPRILIVMCDEIEYEAEQIFKQNAGLFVTLKKPGLEFTNELCAEINCVLEANQGIYMVAFLGHSNCSYGLEKLSSDSAIIESFRKNFPDNRKLMEYAAKMQEIEIASRFQLLSKKNHFEVATWFYVDETRQVIF